MKFFTLPPLSNLELMDLGTAGHFCLAHLYLTDVDYRSHFLHIRQRPNSFILLDNGAAEHSLVSEDKLLKIVEELKPDEVIAPDVLNNYVQTIMNLHSFVRAMEDKGLDKHTNIFFCPQGNSMEEWMKSYIHALESPRVATIGLSKIALPHCMYKANNDQMIASSRKRTLIALDALGLITKPLHLLGAETPLEFAQDPAYSKVRSTDSCLSVWSAMNGQDWQKGEESAFQRIPTPHDYFDKTMTEQDINLAKLNIKFLEEVVSNV
jgi:hypothetical protein